MVCGSGQLGPALQQWAEDQGQGTEFLDAKPAPWPRPLPEGAEASQSGRGKTLNSMEGTPAQEKNLKQALRDLQALGSARAFSDLPENRVLEKQVKLIKKWGAPA